MYAVAQVDIVITTCTGEKQSEVVLQYPHNPHQPTCTDQHLNYPFGKHLKQLVCNH